MNCGECSKYYKETCLQGGNIVFPKDMCRYSIAILHFDPWEAERRARVLERMLQTLYHHDFFSDQTSQELLSECRAEAEIAKEESE